MKNCVCWIVAEAGVILFANILIIYTLSLHKRHSV
jgi:hypothetical protein